MAFGDLLGTVLSGTTTSITNPFSTSAGSATVSKEDLVVVACGERTDNTTTAISDNLGNVYLAQNAGSDAGNATGRLFYSIVTVAGTLNQLTATTTASSNDYALVGAAFTGPFAGLDASPANITNDTTSPYTCPATGTLGMQPQLVVVWIAATNGRDATATSPNLLAVSAKTAAEGGANSVSIAIGRQVVSSTSSIAPEFTFAGGSITASVLGTMSFRQDSYTYFSGIERDSAVETLARPRADMVGY